MVIPRYEPVTYLSCLAIPCTTHLLLQQAPEQRRRVRTCCFATASIAADFCAKVSTKESMHASLDTCIATAGYGCGCPSANLQQAQCGSNYQKWSYMGDSQIKRTMPNRCQSGLCQSGRLHQVTIHYNLLHPILFTLHAWTQKGIARHTCSVYLSDPQELDWSPYAYSTKSAISCTLS